jgi:hypothetical protein
VKVQAAETEKWNCDKCRTENVRMLQGCWRNVIADVAGKRNTVPAKQVAKCMVLYDSRCATLEKNMQI